MTYLLAVGTAKGLFLGRSQDRVTWQWDEPVLRMQRVAAVAVDTRRDPVRLLAGGLDEHWGPAVLRSDDLGATWHESVDGSLAFPQGDEAAVAQVWQLRPGPPDRPGEVWAGVEPAALFRSDDGGETFSLVRGLWDHPHRPHWQPGFGGLCLHTVLPDPADPQRLLVAISSGGVYRSTDGGDTWHAANRGISAAFLPDPEPEFGQCVHKVTSTDPSGGTAGTLLAQNHGGVFRSEDGAATWQLATEGLPADFGFTVVAHPRRAGTAWVVPIRADMERLPVDGRFAVYRTDDAGRSWQDASQGLPVSGYWSVTLRDAMGVDGADPLGLYLGTRSGEVWASADEGASWQLAAEHLPDVLCVRAAVV